jgi:hypothetical protein
MKNPAGEKNMGMQLEFSLLLWEMGIDGVASLRPRSREEMESGEADHGHEGERE